MARTKTTKSFSNHLRNDGGMNHHRFLQERVVGKRPNPNNSNAISSQKVKANQKRKLNNTQFAFYPRYWSSLASGQPSTVYEMKMYFGNPFSPLPTFFTKLNEYQLIEIIKRLNIMVTDYWYKTKAELLDVLQRNKPYIHFYIDGREGLQRCLLIALAHWRLSFKKLYSAFMPYRQHGFASTFGVMKYCEVLSPFVEGVTDFAAEENQWKMVDMACEKILADNPAVSMDSSFHNQFVRCMLQPAYMTTRFTVPITPFNDYGRCVYGQANRLSHPSVRGTISTFDFYDLMAYNLQAKDKVRFTLYDDEEEKEEYQTLIMEVVNTHLTIHPLPEVDITDFFHCLEGVVEGLKTENKDPSEVKNKSMRYPARFKYIGQSYNHPSLC